MGITITLHIYNFIVVGDSKNVIRHMVLSTNPLDSILDLVIERINHVAKSFTGVHFYHVLRENDSLADIYANQETMEKERDIVINGKPYIQPIP